MSTANIRLSILLIASLAGCGQQLVQFQGPPVPTVVSTDPASAATGVGIGRTVSATFSAAMDPTTLTAATFTLSRGTVSVSGTISYAGLTATFLPSSDLDVDTVYTATIGTGAESAAGATGDIGLSAPYSWSFTTALSTGVPAVPTVASTNPGNGSTGVMTNKQISAVFSTAMAPATISATTFTLNNGTTSIAGAVTYTGVTATFAPTSLLDTDATYTATITTGAQDLAGVALAANYTWTFSTGLAPVLLSTNPQSGATGVRLNSATSGVFSEPMDEATLASPATSFTVKQSVSGATVAGTVTYLDNTATFTPTGTLLVNTEYTSTISTAATDLDGVALASGLVPNPWSWTTGSAASAVAPTVTLTAPLDLATQVPLNTSISATFSEAMDLDHDDHRELHRHPHGKRGRLLRRRRFGRGLDRRRFNRRRLDRRGLKRCRLRRGLGRRRDSGNGCL